MCDENIITGFIEEHKSLMESWNTGEINFSQYLEKLEDLALTTSVMVEKSGKPMTEIELQIRGFLKLVQEGYAF